MAARIRRHHTAETRERIRLKQLLNRLQAFALGDIDRRTGAPVEMTSERVTATLALLRKALPDLRATTLPAATGSAGFVVYGAPEAGGPETWQRDRPPPE